MTPQQLASQLRPFEIRPEQSWVAGKNVKGYSLGRFQYAFSRYVHSDPLEGLEDNSDGGVRSLVESLEEVSSSHSENLQSQCQSGVLATLTDRSEASVVGEPEASGEWEERVI